MNNGIYNVNNEYLYIFIYNVNNEYLGLENQE